VCVAKKGQVLSNPSSKLPSTILVVEDEGLVRSMVADELRDRNFEILEASTGDEAVKLLRSGAEVDLVFTDVRMPGSIDGIALTRLIKTEFPRIKVIVTSGHISALQGGMADGFFTKPYDLASVARNIETALNLKTSAPSHGRSTGPAEANQLMFPAE
jgi:two-component system, response regulator PdtaR